jgi:hypothetical protein
MPQTDVGCITRYPDDGRLIRRGLSRLGRLDAYPNWQRTYTSPPLSTYAKPA